MGVGYADGRPQLMLGGGINLACPIMTVTGPGVVQSGDGRTRQAIHQTVDNANIPGKASTPTHASNAGERHGRARTGRWHRVEAVEARR
jgi:hypothetical protein